MPITQILGGVVSAATIVGSLRAFGLTLRGRGNAPAGQPRWDFEVHPLGFVIELAPQLPYVEISLNVINYLGRPLTVVEVKISPLSLYGVPDISHVPLAQDDVLVSARGTQMVVCRRNLADIEARALRQLTGKHTGSYSLVATARYKRREYQYGPVAGMRIEGRINRSGPVF